MEFIKLLHHWRILGAQLTQQKERNCISWLMKRLFNKHDDTQTHVHMHIEAINI